MACKSRVSPAIAIITMVVVLLVATAVAPCHAAGGSGVAVTTTVPASAASPLAQRLQQLEESFQNFTPEDVDVLLAEVDNVTKTVLEQVERATHG